MPDFGAREIKPVSCGLLPSTRTHQVRGFVCFSAFSPEVSEVTRLKLWESDFPPVKEL
jgi:hypothetical protein